MNRIVISNGIVFTGEEILSSATVVIEGDTIAHVISGDDSARNMPALGDGNENRPSNKTSHTNGASPSNRTSPTYAASPANQTSPTNGAGRTNRASQVANEADTIYVDASGRLVTPGLVNAHTHIYSALARGIALKDPPPTNFVQNLERLWWRLDRALTMDEIRLSARLHAVECLKSGVTTIFDHHASQRAIRGSLSTIAQALGELGLRACLCFEVSDREGAAAVAAGVEENSAFIRDTLDAEGTMLRARFGLHASLTLSDATLEACTKAVDSCSVGFHIHVAEDKSDQTDAESRYSLRVIERLARFGVLGPQTICVHGIHLDEREIDILAASSAWLVHCPESNMNNAVGCTSLQELKSAGVRLALGTDGFTANMMREALSAHLLQNHLTGQPGAGYNTVPDLLFSANAALARETFGVDIGLLCEGSPADLVVWDYRPPTPLTMNSLWGHILFGLVNARAEDVIISGRHVLQNGVPVSCNEADLARHCSLAAQDLWDRF
ncbi:MAG: putative aminohydrolase SsnA [Candidatus Eisenbacteria sp.]|nr:putative aminohydrolase SsnA [Candidatus Eisenbacteria bacterium]